LEDCQELVDIMAAAVLEAETSEVSALRRRDQAEGFEYLRNAVVCTGFCYVQTDTLSIKALFALGVALGTTDGVRNLDELKKTTSALCVIITRLCRSFSKQNTMASTTAETFRERADLCVPLETLLQLEIQLPSSLSWQEARERLQPTAPEQHMTEVKYLYLAAMVQGLGGENDGAAHTFQMMLNMCITDELNLWGVAGQKISTDPRPFEYWSFLRDVLAQLDTWAPNELADALHNETMACLDELNAKIESTARLLID